MVLVFLDAPSLVRALCRFTGLVVMGQPVNSDDEDEDGVAASGSDDDEEEDGGDASAGRDGEKAGDDGEEAAEEDSASLVHPVTKVTFDLMRKLRELPISGGSFEDCARLYELTCACRACSLFWVTMWCGPFAATGSCTGTVGCLYRMGSVTWHGS